MAQKSIDWKTAFDSNDEVQETVKIAEAILHHLLGKIPPSVWFFIPRDKAESVAKNSMSTMLKLEFSDIDPICIQAGVTYQHKASKGQSKGEIMTSFDAKAWRNFDVDNTYQILQRRPRIDGKQGRKYFFLCRQPKDGDDKPIPVFPGTVLSPIPRSRRVGRDTFSCCHKLRDSLESFWRPSESFTTPLSPIVEVNEVLEGNEEDVEPIIRDVDLPPVPNPAPLPAPLQVAQQSSKENEVQELVRFSLALDFDRRSDNMKRLSRNGDREIDIISRKQLNNRKRLQVLWLCSEWEYGKRSRSQQDRLAKAACRLVCFDTDSKCNL